MIKPKSLFYDLVEELHANKDMTPEEFTCHMVKMFGGCKIIVPSISELRFYQWIINNTDKMTEFIHNCSRDMRKQYTETMKFVRAEYPGDLSDVQVSEIINNYLEILTGLNYLDSHKKQWSENAARRRKIRHTDYKAEIENGPDDTPPEEDEEHDG